MQSDDSPGRKDLENALRESEARLGLALANTEDLLFVQGLDGRCTYFRSGKPAGFVPETVPGKMPDQLFDQAAARSVMLVLESVVATGKTFEIELEMQREEKTMRYLSRSSPLFDGSGEISAVATYAREITTRRKLESGLTRSQMLDAIGALAAGIGHNFKNILSSISGNAELSLMSNPSEEVRQNLSDLLAASRQAQDLVGQIVALSKCRRQEFQVHRLTPLVEEILKFLRAALPSTVEIRTSITTQDDRISTDPAQIHQLMINLCANAALAMRENGGVLHIALDDDLVDADGFALDMKKALKLTVSDSGAGIAPDIRERIFDPFFTTGEPGNGTGLGLWAVREIMKNHGGSIEVKSGPSGKGTSFALIFPRFPEGQDPWAPGPEESGSFRGRGERVLYVDDDPAVARMGGGVLNALGYSATTATSSRDALEILTERPDCFDLLITDQVMPELTGTRLVEEIRKTSPDIRVILCTGHNETVNSEKVKKIGVREWVAKPFTVDELSRAVRKALEGFS